MNFYNWAFQYDLPALELLGICLLHSLWQILLVVSITKMAMKVVTENRPEVRYWIGMFGLFLCLLSPVFTSAIIVDSPSSAANFRTTEPAAPVAGDNLQQAPIPVQKNLENPDPSGVSAVSTQADSVATSSTSISNWITLQGFISPVLPWISLGWMCGVVVFSIRPSLGLIGLFQIRSKENREVSQNLQRHFNQLVRNLGIRRPVTLHSSALAKVPMVLGLYRPMILLPTSVLSNLSATELDSILLHELAHIRRYDDYFLLIQSIAETLLFYHPAVWLLSTAIRSERENCCDDMVITETGDRKSLATALLALEQSKIQPPILAASEGSLLQRIRRISKHQPKRNLSVKTIVSFCFLTLFTTLFGWTMTLSNADIANSNHETPSATNRIQEKEKKPANNDGWIVHGKVTDSTGNPVSNAEVVASCGVGTLHQTGSTKTDKEGRYRLKFQSGVMFENENSANAQLAVISVHKKGMSEINLCQQGSRIIANHDRFEKSAWGTKRQLKNKLILKGSPAEINFVMNPAATMEGYLTDSDGLRFANCKFSIVGPNLPPAQNVLSQHSTDENGKFVVPNIPVNKKWRLAFTVPNTKKKILSEEFQLKNAAVHKRLIRVTGDKNDSKSHRLQLSELTKKQEQLIKITAKTKVFGKKKPKNKKLMWGEPHKGLQVAVTGFPNKVEMGKSVQPKLVIRNVSKKTILFNSPRWRQDDEARFERQDFNKVRLTKIWYSGFPRIQTIELQPGQQATVDMAGFVAIRPGEKYEKHDSAFIGHTEPGAHSISFNIFFHNFQPTAPKKHLWSGQIQTGDIDFEIVR